MTAIKNLEFKGEFIKECPCSPDSVSCGYYNINLHTGCPYECTYCILQTYLETKDPIFFTNFEAAEKQLMALSKREKYIRIGTGELSDSLAFDPGSDITAKIFSLFKKFPKIVFEFKTKSINIENLLRQPPAKNIIISWSLNPGNIIHREEKKTPDLKERLKAIKKVKSQGYKIGIHFDPILFFKNWKKSYSSLITDISSILSTEDIAWWSLGALRFPESLMTDILKHQGSGLLEGELVKTPNGKYRYFRPLRTEMFKYIKDEIISSFGDKAPLYLCMETKAVWKDVFPEIVPERSIINEILYKRVINNSLSVS